MEGRQQDADGWEPRAGLVMGLNIESTSKKGSWKVMMLGPPKGGTHGFLKAIFVY